MSALICNECEQPREYGATLLHVCHCDETAGDLRVLVHLRDTELTRLRTALAGIAALQTEEPDPDDNDESPEDYWYKQARFEAAEMARAALGESK